MVQLVCLTSAMVIALATPGSMYHRSAQPPPWEIQRRIAEVVAGGYSPNPQLLTVQAVPTGPPQGPAAPYTTLELTFTFLTGAGATLLLSQEDTAPSYTAGNVRTYRVIADPPPVAEIVRRLAMVYVGPADAYQLALALGTAFAANHP